MGLLRSLSSLNLSWALLIGLFLTAAFAQHFSEAGPYGTSSYRKQVDKALGAGKRLQATVTLTFPMSGVETFPLVVAFSGFQCKAEWYDGLVSHIASWGYVVLQYDLEGETSQAAKNDSEEAALLQPLLDWLSVELSPGSPSPAAGLLDFQRRAVLGHGRGGKLATLHYASRDDLSTAVLLDPVDCSAPGVDAPAAPSAVAAMAGVEAECGAALLVPLGRSDKTAAIIGAGYVAAQAPCNPPRHGYAAFANVLGPGTWKIQIKEAGHMQFSSSAAADPAYSAVAGRCGQGNIPTQEVVQDAGTVAVAWLESTFRSARSHELLQSFGDWLEDRMLSGRLAFETLVAERSGNPRLIGLDTQ